MTLEASFEHCRHVAKTRARNFYYSFLLLPKARKDAMCAIYAFMRYCDDISDDEAPTVGQRRTALTAWKAALERALRGDFGDDPILPAFGATIERYSIPSEYFFDMIDGVGSDLEPQTYETFDEVYQYCYRVASVVGLTIIHVFGFEGKQALELAEKCGIGFQLTNILRDIPEDAAMGRVYLPAEDLRRFGLSREAILAAGDAGMPTEGRFDEMMAFEWQRAQSYYEEASPLLGLVQPASQPSLWAMITIYHGVLLRIRELRYDVYRQRARLSALEKSWIVVRAGRARWLGGALPTPAGS